MTELEYPPPPEGDHPDGPAGANAPAAGDPLGTAAIVLGCLGIVVAGIVLCIVTGIVAAVAGGRARAEGRSLENAYIGFLLAGVDGLVWLVLHLLFDFNFLMG